MTKKKTEIQIAIDHENTDMRIAATNGSVYRANLIITDVELSIQCGVCCLRYGYSGSGCVHSIEPITLKQLTRTYGESQAYIRRILVEHYGKRIIFKRGRNGGIRLTNFPLVSGQYHL